MDHAPIIPENDGRIAIPFGSKIGMEFRQCRHYFNSSFAGLWLYLFR